MKVSFGISRLCFIAAFLFLSNAESMGQKNSDAQKLSLVTRHTISISFIQPIISGDKASQIPTLFGVDYLFQPEDNLLAFGVHGEITSASTSERDTNTVSQALFGIQARYYLNGEAQGIYAFGDFGIGRISWNSVGFNSIVKTNTWALMPLGGIGYALRLIGGSLPDRANAPHLIMTAQFGVGYVLPFSNGESSNGISMTRLVSFGPSTSPALLNFKITAGYSF